MSNGQNTLPASDAEPASSASAPDDAYGLMADADGEPCGEFRMDDGADLGGHTLLACRASPQGRRSLFRR